MEIKVLLPLFLEQIYSIQHVSIYFIYSYMEWYSNTLATWCKKLTHWKRFWCWERLKVGREGDDRGGGGWMASPTQWTWVWANSRRWGRIGKPSVLQSMGLQRTRRNWATVTCTHTQTHVMPAECSLEGLVLKLKLQHFGHLMWRTNLLEKTLIAGKDWRWEEKGMTEDEMVGWHHQLDGHEFEQAPGVDDGQGSLACCSPWGHKELDMTKWLNWTECIKCFKESCPLWFSALS